MKGLDFTKSMSHQVLIGRIQRIFVSLKFRLRKTLLSRPQPLCFTEISPFIE